MSRSRRLFSRWGRRRRGDVGAPRATAAVVATAALLVSVAAYAVFGPGPNSANIPSTGQDLSIILSSPPDGTVIPIPPGNMDVDGTCSIGTVPGQPVCVVYVVDVSGSTDRDTSIPYVDADGDGIGTHGAPDAGDNFNGPSGDTEVGEILDGEIAGVIALNNSIGNPANVRVGLVAFASGASPVDVGSAGGLQYFVTPPQLDNNAMFGVDIEEVVRTFRSENGPGATVGKFTAISSGVLGNRTDFRDALQAMNDAFVQCQGPATKIAFFLSDGFSNDARCIDGDCVNQLNTAIAGGTTIYTVGVGSAVDDEDLEYIADQTGGTYVQVTDPGDLAAILPTIDPEGIDHVEVNGMTVPIDALGNFTKNIVCTQPGPIQVTATCFADDPDQTEVSADLTLYCEALCGNGSVEPGAGEECEPPGTASCDASCQRIPDCGDAFVDAPEQCEPPGVGNCDANCNLVSCGNQVLQPPQEECEPPSTATCDANCQRVPNCGDGSIDAPETCEPPGTTTCDTDCTTIACGNGDIEQGEECDPPAANLCSGQCQRIPVCNDGFVDAPEECEPPGTDTCDVDCTTIVCGNSELEQGEECDPPVPGVCDIECQRVATCGDGEVDFPEQCDGGPNCDANCVLISCGNGNVQPGEECDPPGPTCDASCQRIPECGDGNVDAPETCEPPGTSTCDTDCTDLVCGNGDIEQGEECDPPANGVCDTLCQRVPSCGDGDIDAPEQCEPPNTINCDASCTLIACGNGVLQPGEECEPAGTATCDGECQRIPACGDGFLDGNEECEPPNTDACDAACQNKEQCFNEIDDDGDGLIDCKDQPDCPPCEPPKKDPAHIIFGRSPGDLDQFKAHGRFDVNGSLDPATSDVAILLQKSDGTIIYRATLSPGSLIPLGDNYLWKTSSRGDGDGIVLLSLRRKSGTQYTFTLKAYADLSAADSPDMRLSFRVGDHAFSLARRWKARRNGWFMPFK